MMLGSNRDRQKIAELEQECSKWKLQYDALTMEYQDQKRQAESKSREQKTLTQKIVFLQGEIAKYNQITVEVEEYVKKREDEIAALTKKLEDADNQLKKQKQEMSDLVKKTKENEEKLLTNRELIKEKETLLTSQASELKEKQSQINQLSGLLQETEVIFEDKEKEIAALKQEAIDKQALQDEEMVRISNRMNEKERKLMACEQEKEMLNQKITELSNQVATVQANMIAVTDQYTEQINQMKEESARKDRIHESSQLVMEKQRCKVVEVMQENVTVKQQLEQEKKQNISLEDQLKKASHKNTELMKEIEGYKKKSKQAEQIYYDNMKTIKALKEKLGHK